MLSRTKRSSTLRRASAGVVWAVFASVLGACSAGGGAVTPQAAVAGAKVRTAAGSGPESVWVVDTNGPLGTGAITAYAVSPTSATFAPVPGNVISESRPNIISQPAGVNAPQAVAFDAAGHLWFGNQLSFLLVAATLNGGGRAPTIDLASGTGSSGFNPVSLGFASSGNLWTYSADTGGRHGFAGFTAFAIDPKTLAPTKLATTVPSVVPGGLQAGLAFDPTGTMWVTNQTGAGVDTYAGYSVSGGTATPSRTIVTDCQTNPATFDAGGNLWCATQFGVAGSPVYIRKFSPAGAQIATFSVPYPPPSINVAYAYEVDRLQFDPAGNLWALVNGASPTTFGAGIPDYAALIAFNASTGQPTTTLVLTTGSDFYLDFAFAPQ